jgi:hypothetical protein
MHPRVEAQEDQHQAPEEEIEAIIEDELERLLQENEHLWVMQEQITG